MALLAQRHTDWGCLLVLTHQTSNVDWKWWCPFQAPFTALLGKCERLQIAGNQKGLAWKVVAQPHLPIWHCSHRGTANGAACLSCHLKLQTYLMLSLLGASGSPALRMRTSADSWQPEGASLESCCSASSAHGTARTEAQRLGMLACLATSNFKRRGEIRGGPC